MKALGKIPEAMELLAKARKVAQKHNDFENGFSAHQSLFALYFRMRQEKNASVMLLGAQQMLDKERSTRTGAGMEQFIHAKQLFLDANKARLDSRLAMQSRDPQHLKRAHALLESTVASMAASEGESFRGNTSGNLAELCNLWSQVAMARDNPESALMALERELPVWRAQQNDEKLAVCLVNLGRVLLELRNIERAQQHLGEAHVLLQGMMTAAQHSPGSQVLQAMVEMRQLSARCAERLSNFEEALMHLTALAELPGFNQENASDEIKQLKLRQKQATRANCTKNSTSGDSVAGQVSEPACDDQSVDDLVAFIDGSSVSTRKPKKGTRETRKPKQQERLHAIEEAIEAEEDIVASEVETARDIESSKEAAVSIDCEEEEQDEGDEQNDGSGQNNEEKKTKKKKPGKRKK